MVSGNRRRGASDACFPLILNVGDDRTIGAPVARHLAQNCMGCATAADGRQMDRLLRADRIDLIVLDLNLPGKDGLAI